MTRAYRLSEAGRAKLIAKNKRLHADPEFKAAHAEGLRRLHADPAFRAKMKAAHQDPEYKARCSARMTKIWADLHAAQASEEPPHADAADARPRMAAAGAGDGVGLEAPAGQD